MSEIRGRTKFAVYLDDDWEDGQVLIRKSTNVGKSEHIDRALLLDENSLRVFRFARNVISEYAAIDPCEVDLESFFLDDLDIDDLDLAEIAMVIEERFDVCLADEELEKIHTVFDLVQHVASKI